jgi:hypothetical protein
MAASMPFLVDVHPVPAASRATAAMMVTVTFLIVRVRFTFGSSLGADGGGVCCCMPGATVAPGWVAVCGGPATARRQ